MEDDLDMPCPGEWDGEPINEGGEDVSANWPEWLKLGAQEVDTLCNHKESDNG